MFAQNFEPPWWAFVAFFGIVLTAVFVARKLGRDGFLRLLERDWIARAGGLCLALFGVLGGYLIVYEPLLEAIHRKQHISVHWGVVAITTSLFFVGSIFLLAGKHWKNLLVVRQGQRMTWLQVATYVVGMIVCLGSEFGFWIFLHFLGYMRLF